MHPPKLLGNMQVAIPSQPNEPTPNQPGSSQPASKFELYGAIMPGGSMHEVEITSFPFGVGRRADNQLYLHDPTVSGQHAQIHFRDNKLVLEDLGSTNGTFVNGARVTKTADLTEGDLIQFGSAQFELRQTNETPRFNATLSADVSQKAIAHTQFSRLVNEPAVNPHFQPIVRLDDGVSIGYEVLARSSLVGLESPASMFQVAAERQMEVELSQILRHAGLSRWAGDSEMQLFVNTHPVELTRPGLIDSLRQLRDDFPTPKILLEIHESAITTPDFLRQLRPQLKEINVGLAYDDFGAGQARLLELTEVPPDVIKFDISLIRNLPKGTWAYLQTIRSLVEIVRSLGVIPLAEGVETHEEESACKSVGFELAQGYYFGRPEPATTTA